MIEDDAGSRQLRHHRPQLGTASDRDVRTARGGPRNVARELDRVAIALVGDQQQGLAAAERPAVPLWPVAGRQQWRDAGEPRTPLVFLPATGEIAAQQACFGNAEMPAGKCRVKRQRPFCREDGLVEFEAIVVDDAETVMAMRRRFFCFTRVSADLRSTKCNQN